jgi:hypothetical protein
VADRTPIGLARITIDNLNLAPELGDDSDAVAWSDGRAILRHRFFVWEEGSGDQRSENATFQGPWIAVSAEGYEPLEMPLSELLEREGGGTGPFREVSIRLRRGRPTRTDVAELAGDYYYGDGFVNQHLEVRPDGRYHFQWRNDIRTNEPHDADQTESRGRCSVVDGALRLVPEGPFSSDLRSLMRNDFIPIPWGGRRYLIPSKERLVFCSVVNQGGKLEYMSDRPLSAQDVRRRRHPEGLPEVPPEWVPFLLQRSVTGAITEVMADEVAIMNVGARDGLMAGMEFVRGDQRRPSGLKVLFTAVDRCVVRISTPEVEALPDSSQTGMMMMMLGRPEPLAVGEKVSSQSTDLRSGS